MEKKLRELIQESKSIVFFGGAGVSTESGIPDFRSPDGLYSTNYHYPPEEILSHSFFMSNTEEFYRFYRDKMIFREATPNKAHLKLTELEQIGKLKAIITQNVDGLHQAAGSNNVLELHGSIHRNFCMKCHKFHPLEAITESTGIPRCDCGAIIKPDVVLYEEGLNRNVMTDAIKYIAMSDMLMVGGTSLSVYPAASFINYYRGDKLVFINNSSTMNDSKADYIFTGKIGEILSSSVTFNI